MKKLLALSLVLILLPLADQPAEAAYGSGGGHSFSSSSSHASSSSSFHSSAPASHSSAPASHSFSATTTHSSYSAPSSPPSHSYSPPATSFGSSINKAAQHESSGSSFSASHPAPSIPSTPPTTYVPSTPPATVYTHEGGGFSPSAPRYSTSDVVVRQYYYNNEYHSGPSYWPYFVPWYTPPPAVVYVNGAPTAEVVHYGGSSCFGWVLWMVIATLFVWFVVWFVFYKRW